MRMEGSCAPRLRPFGAKRGNTLMALLFSAAYYRFLGLAAIGSVVLLLSNPTRAQIADNWFTVDGGGATSTGGHLGLSGTAGQPDAGTISGGGYVLYGGSGVWSPGGLPE